MKSVSPNLFKQFSLFFIMNIQELKRLLDTNIDYSALPEYNARVLRIALEGNVFRTYSVNHGRPILTYGQLIWYISGDEVPEKRRFTTKPGIGPGTARVVIDHLRKKGLLLRVKYNPLRLEN